MAGPITFKHADSSLKQFLTKTGITIAHLIPTKHKILLDNWELPSYNPGSQPSGPPRTIIHSPTTHHPQFKNRTHIRTRVHYCIPMPISMMGLILPVRFCEILARNNAPGADAPGA